MKSLILRDHEVRRLLDVGSVVVVRDVKLRHGMDPHSAFPARDGMPVFLSGFEHDTPELLRKLSLKYDEGFPCPIGAPGEQRWVRETACFWVGGVGNLREVAYADDPETSALLRDAETIDRLRRENPAVVKGVGNWKIRSAAQMPRWASRAVVEVASVRVARAKSLTVDDIEATGLIRDMKRHATTDGSEFGTGRYVRPDGRPTFSTAKGCFSVAWDEQRGATKYANDPWVWVASVSRVEVA